VEICEKVSRTYKSSAEIRERAAFVNVRARSSISMRACSACAGDYEDPDRTAGEEIEDLQAGDEEYEWQGDEEECDGVGGFDADLGK
jgi:hypothetical protein